MKKSVCNQTEKKICCPQLQDDEDDTDSSRKGGSHSDHNSPGWIPLASQGNCGEDDPAFIVGGENTKLGEMPWTALLGNDQKWFCGGAVINKWYILTAAHCTHNRITKVRLGEWRVVSTVQPITNRGIVFSEEQRNKCGAECHQYELADGTRDCSSDGTSFRFATEGTDAYCGPPYQEFNVQKVIINPGFITLRSGVVVNDIALIKLSRPATIIGEGDSLVSPVCLPLPDDKLVENEVLQGTVIGWGATKAKSRSISLRQKKLAMPLMNNTECGNDWSNLFSRNLRRDLMLETHLCAGGVRGKDSCNGDSGGPFIVKKDSSSPYILAGLVSFGTSYCGIGVPAIFARVKPHLKWIKENLV